jgi:UDP-N-acetylglucosamine transferase subunit ALG13
MNQPGPSPKPKLLVAPLDWGLGHATRCIPLIRHLIRLNCSVFLAGEGRVQSLLETEFPELPFLPLRGYHIRYAGNRWILPMALFAQIPKILSLIKYENQRVSELVKEHGIDGIISDNRFGLYHESLPTVFITHQLMIRTGLGKTADTILQALNYRHINRFSECWVPDLENTPNLAGTLAHVADRPKVPLHYLGPLSRFAPSQLTPTNTLVRADFSDTPLTPSPLLPTGEKFNRLLVILSGPEPQRTLLENQILHQLDARKEPVVLVRGLPGETEIRKTHPPITVFNHLPADRLEAEMKKADIVVARCGYSTIMDLAVLKKKSILIPTPGQTEQEYLAKHLMKNNFALCIPQEKFRLNQALDLAGSFPFQFPDLHQTAPFEMIVEQFVQKLRQTDPALSSLQNF